MISQSAPRAGLTLLSSCCQAVRWNQGGVITMMMSTMDKIDAAIEAVLNIFKKYQFL